jgi:hypothetical protein
MAKTNQNSLTKFYSGKFGQDFVLRQYYNGKSILAKRPRPYDTTPTEPQGVVRTKFTQAVNYARQCQADPELRALYEPTVKVGRSVYRQAMNDYLNAPEIVKIDVRHYKGHKGDTITVHATDDFRVKSVHLQICATGGVMIEEGECSPEKLNQVWTYSATSDVPSIPGLMITATALDHPGNSGEGTLIL